MKKNHLRKTLVMLVTICIMAAFGNTVFAGYGVEILVSKGRQFDNCTPSGILPTAGTGVYAGYSSDAPALSAEFVYENGVDGNIIAKTVPVMYAGVPAGRLIFREMVSYGATSNMQIWEVKVKLPTVATNGGDTHLFQYSRDFYGTASGDGYGVVLKNGGAYVVDLRNSTAFVPFISDNTLQANEWYRVVRIMDFSTQKVNMQKAIVYNSNNEMIGESAWTQTGKLDRLASGYPINSISLAGYRYGTASVYFDDLKIYNSASKISEALASDGSSNKILALDASGSTQKILASQKGYRQGQYHRYQTKVLLPSVDSGSEIKLFSLDTSWTPSVAKYIAAIRGNVVYSNDITNGEQEVFAANGDSVRLEPRKWYKIVVEGDIVTGNFKLMIYDDSATQIGYKDNIYKNTIATGTASTPQSFVLYGAMGYDKPVLFDDLFVNVWTNQLDGTAISLNLAAIDNCGEGVDYQTQIGLAASYLNTSNSGVSLVKRESYILTGTCELRNPLPIRVVFNCEMRASTFNKDNVVLLQDGKVVTDCYSLNYDDTTKEGIISFSNLNYNKTYVLTLSNRIVSSQLGIPIANPKSYQFKMILDPFIIGEVLFKNSQGQEISTTSTLAAGDTVKASAELINASKNERDYLVILAIYKDGVLKDITAQSGNIAAEVTSTIETSETLTIEENDSTAMILVWDNWTDMRSKTGTTSLPSR